MPTDKPTRALLWVAVSSEPQAQDEKASLPVQEETLRSLAAHQGWSVCDVLIVPGFSRRYLTWSEFERDAGREKIIAPQQMSQHWNLRDFDVVAFRDGSRFGRSQSLFSFFVERTIDIGAKLYSLQDGWVTSDNYRMWISLGGYSAAGEIDKLVQYRRIGVDRNAQRGLPVSTFTPMPYTVIRNELGKRLRMELNPVYARLWTDLATLILEGVPWRSIEQQLKARFGHVDLKTGKQYAVGVMRQHVYSPYFWGHAATHYRHNRKSWVFDEQEPAPPGVTVYRNTHEPVYSGDLAVRIKAELRRRQDVIKGNARPQTTYPFTGLLICDECHRHFSSANVNRQWMYYRCTARTNKGRSRDCANGTHIREDKVQSYLDKLLRQVLAAGSISAFHEGDTRQSVDRVVQLQTEITEAERQQRAMMQQMAAAKSLTTQQAYAAEIDALGQRIDVLKSNLAEAMRQVDASDLDVNRQAALGELGALGIDALWALPSVRINQILHRVFGQLRLRVRDGEIVGLYRTDRRRPKP